MKNQPDVNTEYYDSVGDSWYDAADDPAALLRAQARLTVPWIIERIKKDDSILDIGCGGGLISNLLAAAGYRVTGIDLSWDILTVAKRHDHTGKTAYLKSGADTLPFKNGSFRVVVAMNFLEHVENPAAIIREIARILVPGGLFFFHTFNKTPAAWLVAIKFVEWFIRNTPPNLHVYRLFIKPEDVTRYCGSASLEVRELTGMLPVLLTWSVLKNIFKRTVPDDFAFTFTDSLLVSYTGFATKTGLAPIPRE